MASVIDRIMRAGEGKILRDLSKIVDKVNAFEDSITPLTDDQLRGKTLEFKSRLAKGETLDDLLPEAFAVVREAAKRTLGQRQKANTEESMGSEGGRVGYGQRQ